MKIKNLKINGYGKLKNKNINFEKINIIYGKNESGKSTILNFIINILCNISKNKNGKSLSDYDKYLPWNENEFSGKISYVLDNNKKYQVFRNFNKKDTEVYDENGINISNEYNIDKKLGNLYFSDQVKVDKDTLLSTVVASQNETRIDANMQNILIQKVANLAESGDEEVSYKKAVNILGKILLNEVGTNKSQGRPINITKENIFNYEKELEDIKNIRNIKSEIEEKNKKLNKMLISHEKNKEIIEKIINILNNKKLKSEKIKIKENIYNETKNKIEKIRNNKKDHKNNKKNYIILIILIIINILNFIFIKNKIINLMLFALIPMFILILFIKMINNKKYYLKNVDLPVKTLEGNNNELKIEINKLKEELNNEFFDEKEELIRIYGKEIINLLEDEDIEKRLHETNKEIERIELELHKQKLDMNNIEPKLEKLAELEEKLELEKSNLEKLENRAKIINLTKDVIEESYIEMKNNVTPKFNINLSKNIEKLSKGKYKNIIINDDILVELENGQHISIDRLSTGTIEQIYLALRLSVIDEISTEKLPIFLDETFAFYDDERLEEALKFLMNVENQVIIFTCTNREKNILEKLNADFNYIDIT